MKRIYIALLAAVVMTAALTGCTGGGNSSSSAAFEVSASESETPQTTSVPEESSDMSAESVNDHIDPANLMPEDFLQAIADAYGDKYPADGEIPEEILEAEFGLTTDLYEDAKGQMAIISGNNDRVVVVKAAPGKAEDVEKALNDAKEKKIADTLQYPANTAKTNAAQVVRNGDFVAFLLVGEPNPDTEADATSAAAAKYAQEQVQKGVNAFNNMFK